MQRVQVSLVRASRDRGAYASQRFPANQPLADSYARQWYQFNMLNVDYELRPTDSDTAEQPPFERSFIMSAWSPRGAVLSFDENHDLHRKLQSQLERVGASICEVVTFGEDGSWFEAAWIASGLTEEIAINIAADFNQLAIVRWDIQGLHVVPLDGSLVTASSAHWTLTRLDSVPCPMKLLERDTQCVPAGGPWVSKSMEIGAVWQEHRKQLLRLVDCTVCDSGRRELTQVNGQAILLKEMYPASRFGGAVFEE